MENVPAREKVMEHAAAPAVTFTAAQLGTVVPLRVNFMVPVTEVGVTVAVNFTAVLAFDGFLLETSFVVVVVWLPVTTCDSVVLVLPV